MKRLVAVLLLIGCSSIKVPSTKIDIPQLVLNNENYVIQGNYTLATKITLNSSTLQVDKSYSSIVGVVIICSGSKPAIEIMSEVNNVAIEYSYFYGCANYLKVDDCFCASGSLCQCVDKQRRIVLKNNLIQPVLWLK